MGLTAACSPIVDQLALDSSTQSPTPEPSALPTTATGLVLFEEGTSETLASTETGSSLVKNFSLRNYGSLAAEGISITLTTPTATVFTLASNACAGSSLAAGATCSLSLIFSPTAVQTYTATLDATFTLATEAATASLDITGAGISAASGGGGGGSSGAGGSGGSLGQAYVILSDGVTYNYGSHQKGLSSCKYFSVSNLGTQSATSLQASTSDALAGAFHYLGGSYPGTGGTCGATLASDASCTIRVCFSPTSTGVQSESIVLDYLSGTSTATAVRAISGTGVTVSQVAAGHQVTCVALDTGVVRCLGHGYYGATGNAQAHDNETPDPLDNTTGDPVVGSYSAWPDISLPATVYRLDGTSTAMSASQISAGDGGANVCAVTQTQEVRCWGQARGVGNGNDNYTVWVGMPGASPVILNGTTTHLSGIVQVAMGQYFGCARSAAGLVYCWGANNYGQLGDGSATTVTRNSASAVSGINGTAGNSAVSVSAGLRHACAAMDDGTVRCWGYNGSGSIGPAVAVNSTQTTPVTVTGITTATQVEAGYASTCAILSTGALQCWGTGGGLGYNSTTCSGGSGVCPVPAQFGSFDGSDSDKRAISVGIAFNAGGYSSTCAVAESGKIYCSFFASVGARDGAPAQVSGVTDAVAISGAQTDVCFTTTTGSVRCFGSQTNSEFGSGSAGAVNSPVTLNNLVP